MKYRVLGRTGLKISEVGMGAHEYRRPLPTTLGRWGDLDEEAFTRTQPVRNQVIQAAIAAGINFFDATQPEEAKSLGQALTALGRTSEVHVAIMILTPCSKLKEAPRSAWRQRIREDVEDSLRLLQAEYADLLHLHMPERDYSPQRLTAVLEAVRELQAEKRIGFIGASSHQPRFLGEVMRKYDCFDAVMIRYNYHIQEARDAIFPLAKMLEVGVIVMKPLAWPFYGLPFTRFDPGDRGDGPVTPAQHALRWILQSPEVSTVVPGMNSLEELAENVAASTTEGKVDEEVLQRHLQTALGPKGRAILSRLTEDPRVDTRHFARRALTEAE